jgi:membrane fusion protein, heavy metal efflux system
MGGRLPLLIIVPAGLAFLAGVALANLVPSLSHWIPAVAAFSSDDKAEARTSGDRTSADRTSAEAPGHRTGGDAASDQRGLIRLSDSEIETAGITVAAVQGGVIARRIAVPGTIVPDTDRIAHVAVRLSGTVAELRKKIGEPVAGNEVVAVLQSREVADAKSEYLAARLTNELQQDLFERDKALWDKKISTEQQFLRSRNEAARARMRNDIARQKLFALGLNEREIAGLPDEPEASLGRQEVRAPMSGRIVERKVELGVVLGRDNLETELFVVADLGRVWVELSVGPDDLPLVREGLPVAITTRSVAAAAEGKIVFISPVLSRETRSARVVAEIANDDGIWRPGSFVTGSIAVEQSPVALAVPAAAIQTVGADKVVFVRTGEGFAKRPLTLGRSDNRAVEVVAGLQPGEIIAAGNTFVLKAELLKAQAED